MASSFRRKSSVEAPLALAFLAMLPALLVRAPVAAAGPLDDLSGLFAPAAAPRPADVDSSVDMEMVPVPSGKECPPFTFAGKNETFEYCLTLDEGDGFRLWWTLNRGPARNATRVAFEGSCEKPWAWSSWGVAMNSSARMDNATAFVAYADQRKSLESSATDIPMAANSFLLVGVKPQNFRRAVRRAPVALLRGPQPEVEFIKSGKFARMVTLVTGLTAKPQTVIWRGGSLVINFDQNLLGSHEDKRRESWTVDFANGLVNAPKKHNESTDPPAPSSSCTPFTIQSQQLNFSQCSPLDSDGQFQLWWSVNTTTNVSQVAFQGKPEVPYGWAAWAVSTQLEDGLGLMVGSYAFVAFGDTHGADAATAPVASKGQIFYLQDKRPINFQAGYANGPVGIAPSTVPQVEFVANGTVARMLVQVVGLTAKAQPIIWAGGTVDNYANNLLMDHRDKSPVGRTIDFATGSATPAAPPAVTRNLDQKIVHAWMAGLGFGVLLPLGIMVARHLKVWVDPAWFYVHMGLQIVGFLLGVTGWAFGVWLKTQWGDISSAPSFQYNHYAIGVTIFCIASLQILTPILKPHKGEPVRLYWNIAHWSFGYLVIILSFANVFLGFQIMSNQGISYGAWQIVYIAFLVVWVVLMLVLEPLSWWRYQQTKDDYDSEDDEVTEDEEDEDEDDYDEEKPKQKQHSDDEEEEEDDEDDDDDQHRKQR